MYSIHTRTCIDIIVIMYNINTRDSVSWGRVSYRYFVRGVGGTIITSETHWSLGGGCGVCSPTKGCKFRASEVVSGGFWGPKRLVAEIFWSESREGTQVRCGRSYLIPLPL